MPCIIVIQVASDLAALSPHECVAPPLFRFTWAEGANQLLQDLCNTFMTESIDPLTMHIATSEQVRSGSEQQQHRSCVCIALIRPHVLLYLV